MTPTYEERLAAALDRYPNQLKWYEDHAKHDQVKFRSFPVLTIFFSSLTPVLIAFGGVQPGITAAASAAAAVSAGVVAIFNWRSNWVRFARTAELLKSEKVLFDTRCPPAYATGLTNEQALQAFVMRIEAAAMRETGEWGTEQLRLAAVAHQVSESHE